MIKKISYVVVALVLVLLARLLFLIIPGSGQFTNFETIAVDQCLSIDVAPGPEDIQIDHTSGLAYIAATDRRDQGKQPNAGIHVIDLGKDNPKARKLVGKMPDGFAPHGLSLWTSENGERRLFVVNHPFEKHSVEIFRLDDNDALTHLETIESPTFTGPNDIIAVGERQFYVSNMQRATGGLALQAELYLGLPVTDVIYFDGVEAVPAASGLITANGVNVSADGTELYVAEVVAQQVNIYKRNISSGKLTERKRISIGTGVDNIDVAPNGDLYIGAHPNVLAFSQHSKDPAAISPSQVVRLDPKSGEYETVFMAINGEIDGSSVGAYWNGNLLVGNVFESHVMACAPL